MYSDPVYFLNGLLSDLDVEQDAEDWAYDVVRAGEWFTANHPDGRFLQVWVEHVSADACGTSSLTLTPAAQVARENAALRGMISGMEDEGLL